MNRKKQRRKLIPTSAPSCLCGQASGGQYREHDLPPGLLDHLADDMDIEGHWENIRKCRACGQYWHQSTICGHANVEIFEKISAEGREQLVREKRQGSGG
jgi:hypothetical protein